MLEIKNKFIGRKYILYLGFAYTVFAGMCNFPLSFRSFSNAYITLLMFPLISLLYFAFYNRKTVRLYFIVFGLSSIGMLSRYLLEYGEVSNSVNFTPKNMLIYLVAVPLGVSLLSFLFNKAADNKEK